MGGGRPSRPDYRRYQMSCLFLEHQPFLVSFPLFNFRTITSPRRVDGTPKSIHQWLEFPFAGDPMNSLEIYKHDRADSIVGTGNSSPRSCSSAADPFSADFGGWCEGMGQRSAPAPFLTKTYDLVDDRSSDDVVSWNESGTAFVVWKTAEFAKDLLPNYFKHNNFSSFVRQLNTYGFRKTVPDKWEFANENFRRGEKQLLHDIRRRRVASTQNLQQSVNPVAADNSTSPAISGEELGPYSASAVSSPTCKNAGSPKTESPAQLADLTDENQRLRECNQILSSDLSQAKKLCDELLAYLTRCMSVTPEQIRSIVKHGGAGETLYENFDYDDDENENSTKLFGVVVGKKRGRTENTDSFGLQTNARRRPRFST